MKPVLLALAVILACIAYEMDSGYRLAAEGHTLAGFERSFSEELRYGNAWLPADDAPGAQIVRPAPEDAHVLHPDAGSVEREQSTRLFGPGVSRRQQIRV